MVKIAVKGATPRQVTENIKRIIQDAGYQVTVHRHAKTNGTRYYCVTAINGTVFDSYIGDFMSAHFAESGTFAETEFCITDRDVNRFLTIFPKKRKGDRKADQPGEDHKRRTKLGLTKANELAVALLEELRNSNRLPTTEERLILEAYGGVGGMYQEGTDEEALENNEAALTQFYTPDYVCELIFELAYAAGFPKDGTILEPACGNGRFIKHAPDKSKVTAFEISDVPFDIATTLFPESEIHKMYFEQAFLQAPAYRTMIKPKDGVTWLKNFPFDLVVGNPPYGKNIWNIFSDFFPDRLPQLEFFFMKYGARLLKKGGLLIYLTSSNFMRNGESYDKFKDEFFAEMEFVTAVRLPSTLFDATEVGTDVLVFRKK